MSIQTREGAPACIGEGFERLIRPFCEIKGSQNRIQGSSGEGLENKFAFDIRESRI